MILAGIITSTETRTALYEMRMDGIVQVTFKKGVIVDIAAQDENMEAIRKLAQGKKLPVLYRAEPEVIFTKEARERSPLLEKNSPVSASAFLTDSLGYKLIADFYIRFNKPSVPTKTFRKEEDAVVWLKTFLSSPTP